jgi:hypothetical protein
LGGVVRSHPAHFFCTTPLAAEHEREMNRNPAESDWFTSSTKRAVLLNDAKLRGAIDKQYRLGLSIARLFLSLPAILSAGCCSEIRKVNQ